MVEGLGHVPVACWIFLRLLGLDWLVFVLACTFQRLVELAQETPIPPGGLVGQLSVGQLARIWMYDVFFVHVLFVIFMCLSFVFHVFMFLLVMFLFFVCSCLFNLFFVSFVGCGHQIAGEGIEFHLKVL